MKGYIKKLPKYLTINFSSWNETHK